MMEGEIMNDSEALILDWVVETIDDDESILCDEGGQRAEATCGGYLLVARRWTVSGEASWHVEAGFDETPDQPAGAGKDMPASSLRAAQLAAEAFVFQRLGEDPGVAALSRGGLEVIVAMLEAERAALLARAEAAEVKASYREGVEAARAAAFLLGAFHEEAKAIALAAQGAVDLLDVEPSAEGARKALTRPVALSVDLRIDLDDIIGVLKRLVRAPAAAPTEQPATMIEVATTAASLGLSAEELGAAVATLKARDPR